MSEDGGRNKDIRIPERTELMDKVADSVKAGDQGVETRKANPVEFQRRMEDVLRRTVKDAPVKQHETPVPPGLSDPAEAEMVRLALKPKRP